MLFNSYGFVLLFLPLTLLAFHALTGRGLYRAAFGALTVASLIFYAWWSIKGLGLLLVLMLVNYGFAWLLVEWRTLPRPRVRPVLIAGLAFNLAVLGYFKYANFFIVTANQTLNAGWPLANIVLPLGISFFTFQKIALLVDAYKGKVARLDWLDFALFVSFFPQLIAGPIVHHSEVMPQFHSRRGVSAATFAQGLAIFAIGLAKKVLIADTVARFASPVFDAAAAGHAVSFAQGWTAALAYTLQLYFDFSGYSEMAIGAALLFGIRLPLNFASPYKAANIIEFWHRWHMTLSRFLRDYLYIPLGGNRHGDPRRYLNLFLTMLLGGLWHGAGWTFVLWGALHGAYLIANHLWRALVGSRAVPGMRLVAPLLSFLAVVVGWVLFRSASLGGAATMLQAIAGFSSMPGVPVVDVQRAMGFILPLLGVVWLAPNTQTLTGYSPTAAAPAPNWLAAGRWSMMRAAATGTLFALAFLSLSKVTEFLYFQF